MAAVIGACRQGGVLPSANFNRIHVVPPCTVTEAEAREGLAIPDKALDVADAHV
jgi:taurine--2-oxoglutarate transaminase